MNRLVTLLTMAWLAISAVAVAQHDHDDEETTTRAGHEMSPELRGLLVSEMQAIDSALAEVVAALARGDWETTSHKARQIEGTFILRQELTEEQMHELHAVIPEGFLELDRAFHADAGKLAQAASARDGELSVFYVSQLTNACISCHRQFAAEAFPGFQEPSEPQGHHH